MSVYYVCAWCMQRSKEGIGSTGTGVKDSSELPCGCWELNPGLLYEILAPELSLQSSQFSLLSYDIVEVDHHSETVVLNLSSPRFIPRCYYLLTIPSQHVDVTCAPTSLR